MNDLQCHENHNSSNYDKNTGMVNGVPFIFWIMCRRKNLYHKKITIDLKYKISFPLLEMNYLTHYKTHSEDQCISTSEEKRSLCERASYVAL